MIRFAVFVGILILATAALPNAASAQHMDKTLFLGIATGGDAEQRALLAVYLRGLLNGFESTEIILRKEDRALLYCQAKEASLDTESFEEALLNYYRTYPNIPGNVSVGVTALLMLRDLFPCPENTTIR